jgi:D-glycero-D-manno-heptose 1,7-bisphosphate phosphatase
VTGQAGPSAKAVFLDRDGVLTIPLFRNGRSFAPLRLEDFELYPDIAGPLKALKQRGFLLVVVTNQPEVGRGRLDPETLREMHRRLSAALPVDVIKVCPHTPEDRCNCRKPLAGMLLEAATEFEICLPASYMVGDRAGDIDAGHAAGCRSIFVDLGYTAEMPPREPDAVVPSLQGAVDWILANEGVSGE